MSHSAELSRHVPRTRCSMSGQHPGTPVSRRHDMTREQEFEDLRPLLFSIAYRILGSVAEAEDAVQETWVRWQVSDTEPTSAKSFLSAVVTRISIDVLRSARVQREQYV